MDINELKQFEIFKNLNDKEVSLFKEKMKKIHKFDDPPYHFSIFQGSKDMIYNQFTSIYD